MHNSVSLIAHKYIFKQYKERNSMSQRKNKRIKECSEGVASSTIFPFWKAKLRNQNTNNWKAAFQFPPAYRPPLYQNMLSIMAIKASEYSRRLCLYIGLVNIQTNSEESPHLLPPPTRDISLGFCFFCLMDGNMDSTEPHNVEERGIDCKWHRYAKEGMEMKEWTEHGHKGIWGQQRW